jgi:hypothetical protein
MRAVVEAAEVVVAVVANQPQGERSDIVPAIRKRVRVIDGGHGATRAFCPR